MAMGGISDKAIQDARTTSGCAKGARTGATTTWVQAQVELEAEQRTSNGNGAARRKPERRRRHRARLRRGCRRRRRGRSQAEAARAKKKEIKPRINGAHASSPSVIHVSILSFDFADITSSVCCAQCRGGSIRAVESSRRIGQPGTRSVAPLRVRVVDDHAAGAQLLVGEQLGGVEHGAARARRRSTRRCMASSLCCCSVQARTTARVSSARALRADWRAKRGSSSRSSRPMARRRPSQCCLAASRM